MRRLITTSTAVRAITHHPIIHSRNCRYGFSSIPNISIQKAVEYQFNFRTIVKFSDLYQYVMKQAEGIKLYGKTILLEFLNEYPMQSFRRARDEANEQMREEKKKMRFELYLFLNELEGLNFYEKNMRYAIYKKMITYYGNDPIIMEKCNQYEVELLESIKNDPIHVLDIINWLYMLPLSYPINFSKLAFQRLENYFQNRQIREYLKAQRALPMLIKRIYELDWNDLRKYKNIIYFLSYEATHKSAGSFEQLATILERMCMMKLHTVGERVIPKIIDDLMDKFYKDFQSFTKSNKMTILKVFSCFSYMPINYYKPLFDKIHNYIKGVYDLPSHSLMLLPYNKLSQAEITYIQTKIFSSGRQDIAPKLIYSIYKPIYREMLTPLVVKQAYINMINIFKKDSMKNYINFQFYTALIFRFIKLNDRIIDIKKLSMIVQTMTQKMDSDNFQALHSFSFTGLATLIEIFHFFNIKINYTRLKQKINNIIYIRTNKNTVSVNSVNFIEAINVHYNCRSKMTHQLLTKFIQQLVTNPQVQIKIKNQLLFLIQKSSKIDITWSSYSNLLFQDKVKDIQGFAEQFVKYDHKTLKLTNFMFKKIAQNKLNLPIALDLLASINLKLVTSLKGKLISPLKKYLNQLEYSQFDITQLNISTLTKSFKILFYFKEQITEFMEYFAVNLIKKIHSKIDSSEVVNGKAFASLTIYIMQILATSDLRLKTQTIESIVYIIKTLRKKQGIYIKVYELDFLCSHQKHIMINNEVLEHHFSDVVETLKKNDCIQRYKDLYFIIVKLHCFEFVELNQFDLRYFIEKCTQLTEDSMLSLSSIKQCLGYEILRCQDEFVIEKIRLYLGNIIKLAFRKFKNKQSYFLSEYFLKIFSKLNYKEMVTQISSKLLNDRLYPVEISKIVPILNKHEVKNKQFINKIVNILVLSDAYVTYERMQILSWIEKITYKLPQNDFNIKGIKYKVEIDITNKTNLLRQSQKKTLQDEERSVQSGFTVQDPEFDKNYKIFIDYAWFCLKHKNINTSTFKFICRYLYFCIDKIKARIENPIERKQISKIKLYHVFKYLNECGFFLVKVETSPSEIREESNMKQKLRKNRLLAKMESNLNVMRLQKCEKLQKKLQKIEGMSFTYKEQIKLKNKNIGLTAEYLIKQNKGGKGQEYKQFVILTVKKYHCTAEVDVVEMERQNQGEVKYSNRSKDSNSRRDKNKQVAEKSQSIQAKDEPVQKRAFDGEQDELIEDGVSIQNDEEGIQIEETELSLQLEPGKLQALNRHAGKRPPKVVKPLFGALKKTELEPKLAQDQKPSQKVTAKQKIFKTALKLETPSENLYKDYNGYLMVEKNLIELISGRKCVIYDSEKDVFFD